MWLRVNRIHHTRDSWLALLENAGMKGFTHPDYPDAIRLETAAPVHTLPGFDEGWVTVQDASAQGCVAFLAPQNGEHILDLCAAPGGKTTHILEAAPEANVLAVDVDEQRLSRVYDNLKRLGMKATVKQGDGRFPAQWCGEQQFDRILLDAPCSATGVIRRHPDIKWLRRDRDITELAKLQAEILDAVWYASEIRRHAGLCHLFRFAGREQSAGSRLLTAYDGCHAERDRHTRNAGSSKSAGCRRR